MTLSKGGSPLLPPLPPAHPPALLPLLHPLLLVALLLLARNKGTSMAPEVVRTPTIVFQPVRVETMPDSRKPLQYRCHYQIVSSVSVLLRTSKKKAYRLKRYLHYNPCNIHTPAAHVQHERLVLEQDPQRVVYAWLRGILLRCQLHASPRLLQGAERLVVTSFVMARHNPPPRTFKLLPWHLSLVPSAFICVLLSTMVVAQPYFKNMLTITGISRRH
jgi:hypothetical protein